MALFEEPAKEGGDVEEQLAGKEYFVDGCGAEGYYYDVEQQGEDHKEGCDRPAEYAVADVLEGKDEVAEWIEQGLEAGYGLHAACGYAYFALKFFLHIL